MIPKYFFFLWTQNFFMQKIFFFYVLLNDLLQYGGFHLKFLSWGPPGTSTPLMRQLPLKE